MPKKLMNAAILARYGCFGTAFRRDDRLFKAEVSVHWSEPTGTGCR
jgi:hypothetical protein